MKKFRKAIWKYRLEIWRYKLETRRWQFWGWVMDHHPRLYSWCDRHLPFDTLPF